MIYFLQTGDYVKIGFSGSLREWNNRLGQYATHCPYPITVRVLSFGTEETEDFLLKCTKPFLHRGEWRKNVPQIQLLMELFSDDIFCRVVVLLGKLTRIRAELPRGGLPWSLNGLLAWSSKSSQDRIAVYARLRDLFLSDVVQIEFDHRLAGGRRFTRRNNEKRHERTRRA